MSEWNDKSLWIGGIIGAIIAEVLTFGLGLAEPTQHVDIHVEVRIDDASR